MIFGFKVLNPVAVDSVWSILQVRNSELDSNSAGKLISPTKFFRLNDDTFIISVEPLAQLRFWFYILGLGIVTSLFFNIVSLAIVLSAIFCLFLLFYSYPLYWLGVKSYLKRKGYAGRIERISSIELLKLFVEGL